MKQLKNCPFCGSKEVKIVRGVLIPVVNCYKCGATVSFYKVNTEASIAVAWNKRNDTEE